MKVVMKAKEVLLPFLESIREKVRGAGRVGFLANINPKERRVLFLGGVGVALILFFGVVVFPLSRQRGEIEQRIEKKREELKEMMVLSQRIDDSGLASAARGEVPSGFSILSYLEGLADQSRIREKIEYMKPGSSDAKGKGKELSVEVKLKGVSIDELVDYLFRIEQGGQRPLIVRRMMVRSRFSNPRELDATLTVIGVSAS